MKKNINLFLFVVLGCFVLLSAGNVLADSILDNHVKVKTAGETVTFDLDVVKWETAEDGSLEPCACRMLSFRALQTLSKQFDKGIIPKDDLKIFTGWTTDGPEELFIGKMGWSSQDLSFTADATAMPYLTAADMVFYFVQKSTNRAWKVWAASDLHSPAFFEYRTLIKTNAATAEQKKLFKGVIKAQAIKNLDTLPLVDKFEVQELPYYGSDGILHLPSVFISSGMERGAALKYEENGFKLINVD